MWVYCAFDEDDLPVACASHLKDLLDRLELNYDSDERFTVKRVYVYWS